MPTDRERAWELFRLLFKPHPWHGIALGAGAPEVVTVYLEIVPTDTLKYELDKASGHLKVDRPQQFSNVCPTLYGLLPQTYCGPRVAQLAAAATGRRDLRGTATRSTSVSSRRRRSRTATCCCGRGRSVAC